MIHITADDMIGALEAEVAEKGADYIYPMDVYDDAGQVCVYQINGEPMCIVGGALVRLGVPGEQLALVEENPAETALQILKDHGVITYDWDAAGAAQAAQSVQDMDTRPGSYFWNLGKVSNWGTALAAAKRAVNFTE